MLSAAIILTLLPPTYGDYLTWEEQRIMTDLVQSNNIYNCAFLQDNKLNTSLIKISSSFYRTAIYKSVEEIQNSILNENFTYFTPGTLIIYKPQNIIKFRVMVYVLEIHKRLNYLINFRWLLFLPKKNFPLMHLPVVPFSCEFIVARDVTPSYYVLIKYYTLKRGYGEEVVYNNYGSWTMADGLLLINTHRFSQTVDINQTELVACFNRCHDKISGPDKMYCSKSELIKDLFRWMNFRYIEERCTGNELLDIMVEPVPFFLDYGSLLNLLKMTSYVKYLPMERMDWYIKYPIEEVASDFYVRPFDMKVWMSVIATIILGGLLLLMIENSAVRDKGRRYYIFGAVFAVHAFFCAQNKEDQKRAASRILFLAFSFLVLYLVPSYSADLTAYLAVRLKNVPFTDLQSFVENGKYKLVMTYFFHEHSLFVRRNDSVRSKILDKFLVFHGGLENSLDVLCSERLAFAAYNSYKFFGKAKCRLFKIKNSIQSDYFGILLGDAKSPSPYAGIINNKFLKLIEAGVLQKLKQMEAEYDLATFSKEEEEFQPIEFGQVYEILSIMVISAIISSVIFITERIVYNRKNISKRKYKSESSGAN